MIFGNQTIETDGADDISTPVLGSSGVFPASGIITGVGVYISTGSGTMRGVVYATPIDDPAASTRALDLGTKVASVGWNVWSGLSLPATAGIRYRIGLKSSSALFWRYRNSLPAGGWTLNSSSITGETASESDPWDDPIASLTGSNSRGHASYFEYTPAGVFVPYWIEH